MSRSKILRYSIALLLVLAIPCAVGSLGSRARSLGEWIGRASERQFRSKIDRQRSKAPEALALRPGERERYPRREFAVIYDMGMGVRFDSREGNLSWDEHWAPDTTLQFQIDTASMDSLYELAIAGSFFELAPPRTGAPAAREALKWGSGPNLIFVSAGVRDSLYLGDFGPERSWPDWPFDRDRAAEFSYSDDFKRLTAFKSALDRMILRQPAYKSIQRPAHKGGWPID